ncbi:unnamed protein product, partial [Mesorhabditis belari]|uniref:Ubiquitin-like domain-containing protein n=1 Tax=Mesorhabditis belari TaxID=2138241 RepID=A0AAF3EFE5_9BILA
MVKITIRLVGEENDKLFKRIELDPQIHVDDLVKRIETLTNIPCDYQQIQFRDEELPVVEHPLQAIKFGEEIVVKHADLPWWTEYKECVELVLKQRPDKIHGEDSVSKYNIKCHHYGPKGSSSGQVPDVSEFYCYKLLALIGVGPKSHIIPPIKSTGTKTSTDIATQWDDRFELLENVINENSLCADVVVQLVMLRVLLFISDLHEQNCGSKQ